MINGKYKYCLTYHHQCKHANKNGYCSVKRRNDCVMTKRMCKEMEKFIPLRRYW